MNERIHEEEHVHYHGVDKAEVHIRVDDALRLFVKNISPVRSESIKLQDARTRVLFEDIKPRTSIPRFPRSTRDGFALRLKDGETRYAIMGTVRIGVKPKIALKAGEAVYIATGSFLPKGTNTVVMKEYASVDESTVIINRPAKEFENILRPGEDILRGKVILKKGTTMWPQHIALLSMLGMEKVRVFKKPRIAFFSTGDELIDPGKKSTVGIYDTNRPFIRSMLLELGAEPHDLGIVPDVYDEIKRKISLGLRSFDGLILSAGSSVGEKDYVTRAAESISGVRMLSHGVAMRPSSPTGLAVYKNRPFILLPGFPTSAIVSFFVFAVPALARLSGRSTGETHHMINVKLADDYKGKKGLKHYIRVKVSRIDGEYIARIVKPTEAYFSSWLAEANAVAIIDEDSSPVRAGAIVPAFLIN